MDNSVAIKNESGVLRLTPGVDLVGIRDELHRVLLECDSLSDYSEILFDFSNVETVDPGCMSVLLVFCKMRQRREDDCAMCFVNVNDELRRFFELTRMSGKNLEVKGGIAAEVKQ